MDESLMGTVVDGDTLRFVRVVPHSVERVWRAISDEAELRAWMRYPVRFEPRVGGTARFFGDGQGSIVGRVFIFDPPKTLAFSFFDPAREAELIDTEWSVRWDLEPAGEGCRLTFTHRGLGGAHLWGLGEGWHGFLDQLAAYLEGTLDAWMKAFAARGGEEDTRLLSAYRARVSGQLKASVRELAGDATSAIDAGRTDDAKRAIARLEFATKQLYEIARQDGPRPDYAPDPPPAPLTADATPA